MQRLHVVIGVILNENRQVCIAQRANDAHLGGLWEFPGGKVETGESPEAALSRELHEELGIHVSCAEPMLTVDYDYPEDNRYVTLDFWKVTGFRGQASGMEGQPVKWVGISQLECYPFPKANQPVLALLQAG